MYRLFLKIFFRGYRQQIGKSQRCDVTRFEALHRSDGGLRKSTITQYTAAYDADIASYKQTVLTAFQQTEKSVTYAQRYFDVASVRYTTGLDPYLNVFSAQSTLLTNQQAVITGRVQQMTSSVQLIEALGGGWNVNQLLSEREVATKRPWWSPAFARRRFVFDAAQPLKHTYRVASVLASTMAERRAAPS
jgi:hypothetical protein